MPQQPAGAEADDIIHASRKCVNTWRNKNLPPGRADHQEVDLSNKEILEVFDGQAQANQDKGYNHQQKGDRL
jgi:hypothetical protein